MSSKCSQFRLCGNLCCSGGGVVDGIWLRIAEGNVLDYHFVHWRVRQIEMIYSYNQIPNYYTAILTGRKIFVIKSVNNWLALHSLHKGVVFSVRLGTCWLYASVIWHMIKSKAIVNWPWTFVPEWSLLITTRLLEDNDSGFDISRVPTALKSPWI